MCVRSKNAHWKLAEIKARHWDAVCRSAGLDDASSLLEEIATQLPRVIEAADREIPSGFPPSVSDGIFEGMQQMARQLDLVS